MKKTNHFYRFCALALSCLLLISLLPVTQVLADGDGAIHIKSAEDLRSLAHSCTLDSWSRGKTVVLDNDIALTDDDELPIPTFGGTFNGNGHTNLWDPVDAIGSVANYFKQHGWVSGDLVAVQALGQAPGLNNGFKTKYSVSQLAAAGLTPTQPLGNHQQASLLRLDVGTGYEYWYGLPNFYTITRYNHSTHYAMAVWQLGLAVAQARGGY